MDFDKLLAELMTNHRGKLIGILLGVFFALAVIKIGFFPTLFLLFCIAIGLLIGSRIDGDIDLDSIWHRFFKN